MNTCHACTIVDCSIIMRLEQFVRESRSEPAAYHKRKEVHPVLVAFSSKPVSIIHSVDSYPRLWHNNGGVTHS